VFTGYSYTSLFANYKECFESEADNCFSWIAPQLETLGLPCFAYSIRLLCELCGKKDFNREERRGIAEFAKHIPFSKLLKMVESSICLCHNPP